MNEPVRFCFDRERGTALRRMPKAVNRIIEVVCRRNSIHEKPLPISPISPVSDQALRAIVPEGRFICVQKTHQQVE
jgi:hypothetical protein